MYSMSWYIKSRRKSSDPFLVDLELTDCTEALVLHQSCGERAGFALGSLCKNSLILNVSLELSTDTSQSIWIELSLMYAQ